VVRQNAQITKRSYNYVAVWLVHVQLANSSYLAEQYDKCTKGTVLGCKMLT
jgi:hypothetical protein